jgi:signal transduction histidine kinase
MASIAGAHRLTVAGRERRRGRAQQLLHQPPPAALFADVEQPLREALDRLGPRQRAIDAVWRRLLRRLAPSREEFDRLAGLRLRELYNRVRLADHDGYLEGIRRRSTSLAALGVPEEHALLAVAFYLESCLQQLLGLSLDGKALTCALVRLTAATQRLLLVGYAEGRGRQWRRMDEQERARLSRDLHDEIGADLVVLKLYLEMMAGELERGQAAQVGPKLAEAEALVSHTLESVRRLVLDLGPAMLEQIGFLPSVRLYARQFAARTGLNVEVREGEVAKPIPPAQQIALYRVLQGALSNVVKHARARHVRIAIASVRGSVLVMTIEDDGVGFDPGRLTGDRAYGLAAMRDRVESLGGRIHVESRSARPGAARSGTRIEIDLPLKDEGRP